MKLKRTISLAIAAGLLAATPFVSGIASAESFSEVAVPVTHETVPVASSTKSVTVDTGSWNLCSRVCEPTFQKWSVRSKAIAKKVKAQSIGVFTTQELEYAHSQVLLSDLGGSWKRVAGDKARYIFVDTNRYKVVKTKTVSVINDRPANKSCPKAGYKPKRTYVPMAVLKDKKGTKFGVIDIHLTSQDCELTDIDRLVEITKAYAAADSFMGRTPKIFQGDFNSYVQADTAPSIADGKNGDEFESDENRHRANEFLNSKGFVDVATLAAERGVAKNYTMNTYIQKPSDTRNFGPARHLDHFYASSAAGVKSFKILDSGLPTSRYSKELSDHAPIFARIVLR